MMGKFFKPMLLLSVNSSIGDTKTHLTEGDLVQLFYKKKYSPIEEYAIGVIQTEASQEEINYFKEKHNIPQEVIDNVLSANSSK